ncbi:MAG: lipid II flippase MurJ, partial [Oscillospiraceae bacterium]|nr:lipid II flippase MurJ [Oscillospiraceae bacterium]
MKRGQLTGDIRETPGQGEAPSQGDPSKNLSAPTREKGFALATFLVIIGLILSKSTGFLREMLIASKFSEAIRESWRLAFLIPDLVYQLLVGGAIQAAITPSLARSIRLGEEKKGLRSVSIFISIAAVVMGVMVIAGVLLAEFVYPLIWSDPNKSEIIKTASNAAKILFPQIFFMMLAAFSIGILNAYKKFTATAMGPTVYNVFVLLAIIIWGGPSDKALYRVVTGIMIAALIYFLFQVAVGKKYLKNFRFSLNGRDEGFRSLFFLAIPILISSSIIQ